MTLAVYRTLGLGESSPLYFIAPAGLKSGWDAEFQRVSPYYSNQIRALSALIEKQHDYAVAVLDNDEPDLEGGISCERCGWEGAAYCECDDDEA